MDILMQTTYYHPHISGLTLYFQRLAEELARQGHTVTVVTSQYNKKLPQLEKVNRVKVVRTPVFFRFNKGVFLPNILFDAWPYLKKADVVHLNLPSVEAMDIAIAAKILKKPIAATYVCDISLRGFLGSGVLSRLIDLNHFVTLRLSDKIVSFTHDFAKNSRLLQYFENQVVEIYPPVELPNTPKKNDSPPPNLQLPTSNHPILGMAARFAADKGIEYLLMALPQLTKEFPQLKIAFAGETSAVGENRYHNKLLPLIEKYRDRLIFLGQVPPRYLDNFYRQIDLLVVSSINSTEAFGMVQVEAMLEGIPVVATNLPGVRVPIQLTGMGEIAKIADTNDLAQKIILVLNNKNKYLQPAAQIRSIFSLKKTVKQYLTLYENIQHFKSLS